MTSQVTTAPDHGDTAALAATVLDEVAGLLREVIGEDYVLDLEIVRETSFHEDLELESLEFVALAELLTERYGDRVDFVSFLSEKDVNQIIAMEVGELVDFIVGRLTAPAAALGAAEALDG